MLRVSPLVGYMGVPSMLHGLEDGGTSNRAGAWEVVERRFRGNGRAARQGVNC